MAAVAIRIEEVDNGRGFIGRSGMGGAHYWGRPGGREIGGDPVGGSFLRGED